MSLVAKLKKKHEEEEQEEQEEKAIWASPPKQRTRKLKIRRAAALNIGLLIGLFVFILIGIVLLPVITSEVSGLTSGTAAQVTGTNATVLNLVPLFYILVLVIVPAVIMFKLYQGRD
ncbi:VP1/VP3 family protein [Sulfuracidifex metallicus]|uniref:DUF1035 domain-containing protein n=1 Tax=Sulfuracidifex metallicus DSM 6482 = JCM 9184 TaxID=523847 RepID=A0A6A9QP92_SULME|nr:VP1/VP3 family protein [Sulfuracidifex metallicus]MUN29979.1 DUF1035 domain-containing protein [Sulfuracidifex metallicus DSM 6482 = JCM 9184]WOE51639.1 VP1/VP3 family protein [Sulfuracidifex metallicus DSM 6482 = JCM 9184]